MRELADGRRGDPETNHPKADAILVEAVEWLADATERSDVMVPMARLVAAYHRVGKWYA